MAISTRENAAAGRMYVRSVFLTILTNCTGATTKRAGKHFGELDIQTNAEEL